MACRTSGYFGRVLKAGRGMTQRKSVLPTFFNLMVDAIAREQARQLKEGGTDTEDIRKIVTCFYADSGLVTARDAATL